MQILCCLSGRKQVWMWKMELLIDAQRLLGMKQHVAAM